MLLSARILTDVTGVNSFGHAQQAVFTEGDGPNIYFQLIDQSLDRSEQGFNPPGRRYVPASGATLECILHNLDDAKKVQRFASQPFTQDPSIWVLTLLSTDKVRGTVDLLLTLTEGTKVTRGRLASSIHAYPQIRGR